MKRLITVHDQINTEMLLGFADGIIIGNDRFGTRLTHSFSLDEIMEIATEAKALKKEVFLMANQMMMDSDLEAFSDFLDELNLNLFDGIVVADLGALVLLNEKGLAHKAIYNPETLSTNYYDFNFLSELNVFGVYTAKEITLDDLKMIGEKKKLKMFMVGHGHLNMFYSKRQLIHNYENYLGEDLNLHKRQDLKIIEEKRVEEPYPILEDDAGTHVFRSHVMQSVDQLDLLSSFLDYFVIDTLFKDDHYGALVCEMYAKSSFELKDKIQRLYDEVWDDGFFFKKTIYKGKGGEQ